MRPIFTLLLVLAALLAGPGYAQDWIVFVPHERDFRVLFPSPPSRRAEVDGAVAFRSSYDDFEYSVFRLPPGVPRISNAEVEIQRRLRERLGDDAPVRAVHDEDDDGQWQRHVFEVRRGLSIHRLVEHRGRYYEMQVVATREKRGVARQTARDFFNSFQLTGVALPDIGGVVVQRIEAWCAKRTDPFTRAFCEYSVCLQPGYEKFPRCNALPGR